MAFCRECGAQVDDRATECPACHTPRMAVTPPAPPVPPTAAVLPPSPVQVTHADARSTVGFIGALFDFSFTSFITTKLIKLLYALGMLGAAGFAVTLFTGGLATGGFTGILMALVGAPLAFLFGIVYIRVVLELIIVLFRMAEHTADVASALRQR